MGHTHRQAAGPEPLSQEQRKRNMARVPAPRTSPGMPPCRGVQTEGFRYRLHVRALPGSPDLVFPARRAIIFVHGCFWHGHDCELFKLPASNTAFWEAKISRNQARDQLAIAALIKAGWRILDVWECAL